ncbi:MAG: DUF4214 domain-containing protein [Acidimicrobiales bacterium]|nr:DUF4214 domain-containing protein [Acidimicrobiales bacterium]
MLGRPIRIAVGVVAVLLFFAGAPALAQQSQVDSAKQQRRSVETVVEVRDGHSADPAGPHGAAIEGPTLLERVERTRQLRGKHLQKPFLGRRVAGSITTTYEAPTPVAVRSVIDAAVQQWDSVLNLSPGAPVEISILWTDLGSRLLGQAGTEGEYRDAAQFPTDRWYPAALANQLANFDVNGAGTPEILVELNSGLGGDWYIGKDGRPGDGQIDLYSVVLHEIAHGMGFMGSASATRAGAASVDYAPPSIYDDFIQTDAGKRLTKMTEADAVRALTSGALAIDVGFGRTMPVSAPTRFVNGSSYSHFDESLDPSAPGALMTPSLRNGEIQRSLDAAVIGVLDQVGWRLATPLLQPSVGAVSVSSETVEVTWEEEWSTPATFPDAYSITATPTTASGPLPSVESVRVLPPVAFEAVLPRLQNGTAYTLSVAPSRAGWPPGVSVDTTVVLPANPNRVTGLKTVSGSPVELVWDAPPASGKPISEFEVQYRTGSERTWSAARTTVGQSARFELPNGRYFFRVRAINSTGPGPWKETPIQGVSSNTVRYLPVDGQIARLYAAYLGRAPDQSGLDYWRTVRAEGAGMVTVSTAFSVSAEFEQVYGDLTDIEFVNRVYRNVLGREPDASGYAYWLNLLDGGAGRGRIMLEFSESPEFVTRTGTAPPQSAPSATVERIYIAALRRLPTTSELQAGHVTLSRSGGSQLAQRLVESTEFRQLHGPLNNAQFLDVVNENVSEGRGDQSAVGILLAQLQSGTSRGSVLARLAATPAFALATGSAT